MKNNVLGRDPSQQILPAVGEDRMHLYVLRKDEALTLWQKLGMPFLPFSMNLWGFVFATLLFITSTAFFVAQQIGSPTKSKRVIAKRMLVERGLFPTHFD